MNRGTAVVRRAGLLVAAAFAVSCTESVAPERATPGAPLFSFSTNGITLNQQNGTLNEGGTVLMQRFAPVNPHHGDAVIATFYWFGSTNVIDSVADVLTDANFTPVGNSYHLVEYVTAGGISMATYVATNVQNFPDASTDPGQFLGVRAYLSTSVIDGGAKISAWTGVEDAFPAALGEHRSASGSGSAATTVAPGPIAVDAGGLAYAVTMSNGVVPSDPPPDFASIGGPGSDAYIREDGRYRVVTSASTVDPQWTWNFQSESAWLATVISLRAAGAPAGDLTVSATTTGSDLDPDGYTVTVDGTGPTQTIATGGTVSFSGLAAGDHSVALTGVAENCAVTGSGSQTVTVPAGGAATVAFSVTCSNRPGALTVTATTTGADLDPDGYTVTVDGTGPTQAIATGGSVSFSGLAAGDHSVELSGVAANCTATGNNPQTVTVPPGGTVTAAFSVTCTALSGNVTVTTNTTGSDLDADGYTATLDGTGPTEAIATNGSVTFADLAAGDHSVALSGLAANCTVTGASSQTVSVTGGGTATAAFAITCTPLPGNLTVIASTSGLSLDLDGYAVTVDGQTRGIASNGSVTFTDLSAGNHSVALSGIAVNCTVDGTNPRDVSVPSRMTAATTFSVSCVPGPATRLVFTVQPSNASPLGTISPAVRVMAVDVQGNTVTTFSGPVTIVIGRNAGLLLPGTLSGTTTIAPVNGVATFSDLRIDQKGNGYTLRVRSSGLVDAESASFNIALVCTSAVCL